MMKSRECRATRQEIDQVEAGEALSAQALQHVESCAACGAFQNERGRLRALLTSLEPVTAPADFDFRLRARIAAQTDHVEPRSFFGRFVLSTPAIALAAVVVLGVSIVWFAQHQSRTSAVATTTQTRQGNAPSIENSSPPNKEAKVVDSAPASATGANPKVDAPIYLVKGGKLQLKDPGASRSIRSTDQSVGSAPSIRQGENGGDVYISAPVKPMVLSLQDDNGATRRISLPPVSFGSQRLLESRVVPASLNSGNGRVW